MLSNLKEEGYTLAVATSKPTVFAKQIIEYFQLESFFDLIVGSHLDGSRSAKSEIIAEVLQHFNLYPKEQFIMIGDRNYDVLGAYDNQIDAIGVTYGYGSLEELKNESPTYIVDHVSDLQKYL